MLDYGWDLLSHNILVLRFIDIFEVRIAERRKREKPLHVVVHSPNGHHC